MCSVRSKTNTPTNPQPCSHLLQQRCACLCPALIYPCVKCYLHMEGGGGGRLSTTPELCMSRDGAFIRELQRVLWLVCKGRYYHTLLLSK